MDSLLDSFGMGTALPRLDRTTVWCIFLCSLISFHMYASLYSSSVADCQTVTSRFRLLSPSPLLEKRGFSVSLHLNLDIARLFFRDVGRLQFRSLNEARGDTIRNPDCI
ncbi:uncharacterized protein P174DRAFT_151066 [Aspergillus novofumigatus IBT 16806]|uniref:Uncharacterized protein n=1 Tax=Aspergillus novofumigatus (strain IBT 16806) TaxID=1392255 RepID=A0A2I1CEI7_ASPN1|nr:uncharacterized protein P174DRAFT_151066 [Aspergillus novofumigatus IBT 16806]PKX96047.1 hypothetical protein P174DRAFT_151066 [Aspergillus novofumigatus IBT 16806]